MKLHRPLQAQGFTIVELLIVIVVIAILAAITIVAYTGIQQRAFNNAMISGARQTAGLLQAYIANSGTYPTTDGWLCVTRDNSCSNYNSQAVTASNSALMSALASIGTPIASAPTSDITGRYGISYVYRTGTSSNATATWNGANQPVYIYYVLKGGNANCGLSGVSTDANPTSYNAMTPSTTGYSWTNTSTGLTGCYVHIDGPTV